jgi:competence protein ComEC
MGYGYIVTPVCAAALSGAVSYYTAPLISQRGAFFAFIGGMAASAVCAGVLRACGAEFLVHSDTYAVRRRIRIARIYALAAMAGFFIGLITGAPTPVNTGVPPKGIIGIYGRLRDDPRVLTNTCGVKGMGTIALAWTRNRAGREASADGSAGVFFPEGAIPRMKEFGRGCEVYLEGNFLTDAFTGEQAAGEAAVYDAMFYAVSTHIVKPAPAIEQFRTELRQTIAGAFAPYPWGGFALALLFGIKDDLHSELSRQFRDAGCSHVLALSGMHLAVISAVIAFFLRKPLGLKAASVAGAVFICGYMFLVGSMPSLDRAALMYLIGTVVIIRALPAAPLSVLSMAFLLQILIQPASGASYSFILSYLALAGILILNEPVHDLLRGMLPDAISTSLAASIAAFLGTAAVSAAFFGEIKPFGILASLVLVPLTTVFMIGSMAALALAFAVPPALPYWGKALSLFYTALEYSAAAAARPPGLRAAHSGAVWIILGASAALAVLVFFVQYIRNNRSIYAAV